jgi:hypothetical protein
LQLDKREQKMVQLSPKAVEYKRRLFREMEDVISGRRPFPNSRGRPNLLCSVEDEAAAESQYETALGEYAHHSHGRFYQPLIGDGRAHLGHKLHLNVLPGHVRTVSEYLKRNQFNHKYLSGGEVALGKIFTIYIGPHDLAFFLADKLSEELNGRLCTPVDSSEIEYGPFVSGRFAGQGLIGGKLLGQHPQAGIRGMALFDEDIKRFAGRMNLPENVRHFIFNRTFNPLAAHLGSFFYGE